LRRKLRLRAVPEDPVPRQADPVDGLDARRIQRIGRIDRPALRLRQRELAGEQRRLPRHRHFRAGEDLEMDMRPAARIAGREDGGAENQEAHHKYMQGIREAEQKGNANENGYVDGQKARENETEGSAISTPKGEWDDKTGSGPTDSSKFNKAFAFAKKRGGVIGLMAIFGVGGGIMAAILAPTSMFMSVLQGIVDTNDTSSPVVNRRFVKTMQNMMTGADQLCESSLKIRCRMGKVSNSALSRLHSNGVKATFLDGSTYDGTTTKGYPKGNPVTYTIDTGDGKPITIDAKNLMGELSKRENAKMAAKVLGRGGAFNLKVRAWSGKYLAYRLYDRFGLLRNGGIADGKSDSDGDASKSRLDRALAKLRERIPGINQFDDFKDKFTLNIDNKVRDNLKRVSKAGIGYTVAVAGCVAVKAPRIVAAAVAAVEVLRVTSVTMDLVLSPVSKMMGGGVDTANSLTPEDSETLGTIYTSTSIDDTGKSSSMLDSPILQSAMGINTNKVAVSQKFTPGFSYLTNPIVTTTGAIADSTSDACSYIMSPAAMYTAMAIDAAGTVAASTTGVGLVVKLVGSYLASSLASWAIEQVIASYSEQALAALLDDDKLASAVGKDLGDIVGIGAFAFFSSGGMARGLPTLKSKQIFSLAAMQKEMEEQQKNMDIATLSPFDTSSKYTFLGSIVNNARMAALDSGFSTNSLASIFGNIFRMPAYSLSPNVGAT
ncbi:hypothetical protein B7Z28_00290, partial [Candidatus Saccharibacteria bacterium 32-45-3]